MGLLGSHASHAQTVIESEYIYIGVEAEDAEYKNERWVLTEPGTPTLENDPDGNHSDQASGSQYLELLPDIRVTHDDPMGPPTAYWGQAGTGPDADYVVNFPEAGRYYVHARAYSTGTEDNGIHFGINGTWPVSGRKMQFCSAGKRAWWWSSAQRDAGGNGACGTEKTIWLDIEEPGEHTVSISAREDGFEIDRFALIKDLSNNTRICSPVNVYGVNCRNGSIGSADEIVDMQVRLRTELPDAGDEAQPDQLELQGNGKLSTWMIDVQLLEMSTNVAWITCIPLRQMNMPRLFLHYRLWLRVNYASMGRYWQLKLKSLRPTMLLRLSSAFYLTKNPLPI